MKMDDYQEQSGQTAMYPEMGTNIHYPTMKLCGEAGEFAEKVGKLWRNQNKKDIKQYTEEETYQLALELGDGVWYIQELATALGYKLSEIAQINLDKLRSRANREVIKSEGDNR